MKNSFHFFTTWNVPEDVRKMLEEEEQKHNFSTVDGTTFSKRVSERRDGKSRKSATRRRF